MSINATAQSEAASHTGDYTRVVGEGHYAPPPDGLWGKYDNVRLQWENQVSSFVLEPVLLELRARLAGKRGLRIADLGCGTGEGWDLVTRTCDTDASVGEHSAFILNPNNIEKYHGFDLCEDMVLGARARFSETPQASFEVADLGQLELGKRNLTPCDLYYSSYGSPSHLDDQALRGMLLDINAHRSGYAVVVLDLIGQFSPEWPRYWGYSASGDVARMQPYTMTWLYPPEEQADHVQEFCDYRLRFWGGAEFASFLRETMAKAGVSSYRARLVDRSVLIGRHMDTREFNGSAPNIRRAVNKLFDFNTRTAPHELESDFRAPSHAPVAVRDFFDRYQAAWNGVVEVFRHCFDDEADASQTLEDLARRIDLPQESATALEHFVAQASSIGWLKWGDPRSAALEPQFAFLLRQLEFQMQRGLGCGHGLVAVIEIQP